MAEAYQPLLSAAFLRSHFSVEAEAFLGSAEDADLRARLRAWADRPPRTETQDETGFVTTFFFGLWGYRPSGSTGEGRGFSAHPRYSVPRAGAGGSAGIADLALGWFDEPPLPPTPQVVCEFKDIRSDLDAPQRRKGSIRSPVKQCADYLRGLDMTLFQSQPIQPRFGVVSDMNEFRLYWRDKMPAQYQRFIIRRRAPGSETALLDDTPEAGFQRFLFARLFRPDMLLSKTGEPPLLGLIRQQLVQERQLEEGFYKEYRQYREVLIDALLAANPAWPHTPGRMVQTAQKLLDRLIFVLFCEDMGQQIAYPPQLLRDRLRRLSRETDLRPEGDDAWDVVRRLFARMNEGGPFDGHALQRFNGGLFAPDAELDGLNVPNSVFFVTGQDASEEAIRAWQPNLLFFAVNYNFGTTGGGRSITLYTLGRIFEQSITELEVLQAQRDLRPSLTVVTKRKRDGVYYTPEWVVALVVEETIGARLEAMRTESGWDPTASFTREEIARKTQGVRTQINAIEAYQAGLRSLTVVDPACGSGAFLIYALDYLLRETRRAAAVRETLSGGQALLFDDDAAIKDILSRNIYGVDINPASVELTRLALWLHTARAHSPLSDLDHTIRCGNSLVGPDIANINPAYGQLGIEGQERINVFDWEAAFPEVFARGGFDCVIGNPPYVKLQNYRQVLPEVADYLRRATAPGLGQAGPRYRSAQTGNTDLYLPFIEKGLALLRPQGRLGYIAPSLWLLSEYGDGLRRLVHRGRHLDRWVDFGSFQVFEEVTTYTALQFFTAAANTAVRFHDGSMGSVVPVWDDADRAVPYEELAEGEAWTLLPRPEREVMHALRETHDDLGRVADIAVGLQATRNSIYHLKRLTDGRYETEGGAPLDIEDAIVRPLVRGSDISPWRTRAPHVGILFPYDVDAARRVRLFSRSEMINGFPQAWRYLAGHEAELRRAHSTAQESCVADTTSVQGWWGYVYEKNLNKQDLPKLFVAQTVQRLAVAPDPKGAFAADNVRVNCILPARPEDFWFLLAVLHGRVCDWVFRRIAKPKANGYFEANKQFIAPLPIPRADAATKQALGRRARIMRALHTRRARALALLERRLGACTIRTEAEEWLLAGQVAPLAALKRDAPAGLSARDKTAWAKRRQADQVGSALGHVAVLLQPDATFAVVFEQGELRLTANGLPVFDRVFLDAEDGEFIARQWRLALRGRRFVGEAGAAALSAALRRIARSDNAALRRQVVALIGHVLAYDAAIARNESLLEAALDTAYALTPAERAVIDRANPM